MDREFIRHLGNRARDEDMIAGREGFGGHWVDSPLGREGEKAVVRRDSDFPAVIEANPKDGVCRPVTDHVGHRLPANLSCLVGKTGGEDVLSNRERALLIFFEKPVREPPDGDELKSTVSEDADGLVGMEALPAFVEPRAVEEPSENVGHLLLYDPRSVVLNDDEEFVLVDLPHFDGDIREDVGVRRRVEGVVHGLLDRREEGLRWRVVPENLLVPFEELRDADFPLLLRKLFRNGGGGHTITANGQECRWAFPSLGSA